VTLTYVPLPFCRELHLTPQPGAREAAGHRIAHRFSVTQSSGGANASNPIQSVASEVAERWEGRSRGKSVWSEQGQLMSSSRRKNSRTRAITSSLG
jgi:hypothetical protein